MKLLYGSQNFGYSTPESDKDWIEIVYPTWEQITNHEMTNKEVKNEDGSITKMKDIRLLYKMITKSNFSDLQFLFSVERYNCEDLSWFFENKDRLIQHNRYQLFKSNAGDIRSRLKNPTPKGITRALVFIGMLYAVLENRSIEKSILESQQFMTISRYIFEQDKEAMLRQVSVIEKELNKLEIQFNVYENQVDTEILKKVKQEIQRLLQKELIE